MVDEGDGSNGVAVGVNVAVAIGDGVSVGSSVGTNVDVGSKVDVFDGKTTSVGVTSVSVGMIGHSNVGGHVGQTMVGGVSRMLAMKFPGIVEQLVSEAISAK